MVVNENSLLYKIQYLSYFVTRAFLIAVFCLLLLFGIFISIYFGDLFFNVKSGNYKSPIFNGYVIVSKSMVPTININDAIVVKRNNNNNYNVGDVISFFSTEYDKSGIVVTHRIVDKNINKIDDSVYTTKGDNNPIADYNKVTNKDVYGKVLFVIPKLGYYQEFLSKPKNFIVCLLIPAFVVIIYDVYRIFSAFKQDKLNKGI